MPLYRVAPTRQLPHTIDLIQRQSAPRFANEVERGQQYPDPELGALSVVNTTVEVFNGTGWIAVGGDQPTRINNLQDVDARFPPDGAVLTWSSAAQAWGWSMPAAPVPECVTFTDDFERADGPLGTNWMEGTPGHHFISDGGVAAVSDSGAVIGAWRVWWAEEIGAEHDQFIEMTVSDLTSIGPDNYLEIYTQMSADGDSAQVAMLSPGSTILDWTVAQWEGTYGDFTSYDDGSIPVDWSTSPTFTFRLESYTTGRQVLSINSSVVSDWDSPAFVTGPYVGFQVYRGVATISPRIESISGGCLESA